MGNKNTRVTGILQTMWILYGCKKEAEKPESNVDKKAESICRWWNLVKRNHNTYMIMQQVWGGQRYLHREHRNRGWDHWDALVKRGRIIASWVSHLCLPHPSVVLRRIFTMKEPSLTLPDHGKSHQQIDKWVELKGVRNTHLQVLLGLPGNLPAMAELLYWYNQLFANFFFSSLRWPKIFLLI